MLGVCCIVYAYDYFHMPDSEYASTGEYEMSCHTGTVYNTVLAKKKKKQPTKASSDGLDAVFRASQTF